MVTIGQLMMFGIEGTKATPTHRRFLQETGAGGIILFPRNYRSPRQLADLIDGLQDAAPEPLVIGIDQEGGRVARLTEPFTRLPPMAVLGRAGAEGEALAADVARVLGRELAAVGITVDFAPVLDVATNPWNPVIGDRAMAGTAEMVARLGRAFIGALQGEGVAACGKHFPGHGDTSVDSHLGLPLLPHTRRRLDACELVPFRAAIDAGVASIMTAHLLIPQLDARHPASVSPAITTGLLRRELGFAGLVFSDDMLMQGIASRYGTSEWAWRAIAAGADMVPVCHEPEKQRAVLEGLRRAVGDGAIDVEAVGRSLSRLAAFKARFAAQAERPPLSVIGCREHREIALRLGRMCSRGRPPC